MIKGAVLRAFLDCYGERFGQSRLRALADRASEIHTERRGEPINILELLPSTFYPVAISHACLDALSEGETEQSLGRLARETTRAVIAASTNSVYRFVLARLVSPELYAYSVPRFWKQLHTTGERQLTILGKGSAESVVSNWPGHHPLLCTFTIETMVSIFEAMGLKDVRWKRLECVARGNAVCRTELKWRPKGV